MKKSFLTCGIATATLAIVMAFSDTPQSSISGKITPIDAADAVWAVSTTDSVKAAISTGAFSLQVKPGTYKLIVDAKAPRKDVLLENIEVKDQPVDVGEIVIQ
jgi:hypothetical protein